MLLRSSLFGAALAFAGLLWATPGTATAAGRGFRATGFGGFHVVVPRSAFNTVGFRPAFRTPFATRGFPTTRVVRPFPARTLRTLGTPFVNQGFLNPFGFGFTNTTGTAFTNTTTFNNSPATQLRRFLFGLGGGGSGEGFVWGGNPFFGPGLYDTYFPGLYAATGTPYGTAVPGYTSMYYPPEASQAAEAQAPQSQTPVPMSTNLQAGDNGARVHVRAPSGADIWFDSSISRGATLELDGNDRTWVSPPLRSGQNATCEVHARWQENGNPVDRVQTIQLKPGLRANVNFTQTH